MSSDFSNSLDKVLAGDYINERDKFVINGFVIPDEKIPKEPFKDTSRRNINKLTIPTSVVCIKDFKFNNYYNLRSVKYFASTCIPAYCFNNCLKLEDIVINNEKCFIIDNGAFRKCRNLEFVNMRHIEHIGCSAFEYTDNLKRINLPNTLIGIDDNAFKDSGLKYIIIPENVEHLGKNIFKNCKNLTRIIISDYLRSKYVKNDESFEFDFEHLGLFSSQWEINYKDGEWHISRKGRKRKKYEL